MCLRGLKQQQRNLTSLQCLQNSSKHLQIASLASKCSKSPPIDSKWLQTPPNGSKCTSKAPTPSTLCKWALLVHATPPWPPQASKSIQTQPHYKSSGPITYWDSIEEEREYNTLKAYKQVEQWMLEWDTSSFQALAYISKWRHLVLQPIWDNQED